MSAGNFGVKREGVNICIRTFLGQVLTVAANFATTVRDVKIACELQCAIPSDLHILKHKEAILDDKCKVLESVGYNTGGKATELELAVPTWWAKFVQSCTKGETEQVMTRIRIKMNQLTPEERAFTAAFIAAGTGNHTLLARVLRSDMPWRVNIEKSAVLSGRTLLHLAVTGGNISCVVNIIVSNKGFVLLSRVDQNNESPIQLASRLNNREGLCQLLNKYQELRDRELKTRTTSGCHQGELHERNDKTEKVNSGMETREGLEGQNYLQSGLLNDEQRIGRITSEPMPARNTKHNLESFEPDREVDKAVEEGNAIQNEMSQVNDEQVAGNKTETNNNTIEHATEKGFMKWLNDEVSSTEASDNCICPGHFDVVVTTADTDKNDNPIPLRSRLKLRIPARETAHAQGRSPEGDLSVPVISIEHANEGEKDEDENSECEERNARQELSPTTVESLPSPPIPHPPTSPPTHSSSRSRRIVRARKTSPLRDSYRSRSESPIKNRNNVDVHSPDTHRERSPDTSRKFTDDDVPNTTRITRRPASSKTELSRSRSLSPNRIYGSSPRMTSRPRAAISPLAANEVNSPCSLQSPGQITTSPRFGRRFVNREDLGNALFSRERSKSAILPRKADITMVYGFPNASPQEAHGAVLSVPLYMGMRRGSLPTQSLSVPSSPQLSRKRHSLKDNSEAHKRLIDLKIDVTNSQRRNSLPWNEWRSAKEVQDPLSPTQVNDPKMRRKSFDIWLVEKDKEDMQKQLQELTARHEEEKDKEGRLRKLSRTAKTYEEWLEEKGRGNLKGNVNDTEHKLNDMCVKTRNALKFEEWLRRKDEEAFMREDKMRREAEKQYEEKRKKREEELIASRTFRKSPGKVSTLN